MYIIVNGMKKCSICNETKNIEDFNKDKSRADGFQYKCRQCNREVGRKYYKNNKEEINAKGKEYRETERGKEIMSIWRKNNKEKEKKYRKDNKEKISIRHKKYAQTEKGKESIRRSSVKRYSTLKGKISISISTGIYKSLNGKKNGRHWETLVGYKLPEFMDHMESLFEPWMSWSNYGRPKKGERRWSIDHVLPISSFNFNSYDDKEFKECWALENLQPLCFIENTIKYNKVA